MIRAVVSLSGGMDSTTVLAVALTEDRDVQAVGFKYGSKHNEYENAAAQAVADHYKVPFRLIDLSPIMGQFKSALLKSGGAIPEGHYEAESMRQTVVPGRNLIFASILTGIAWSEDCSEVWLGIHAGDHYIYPDCRPLFYYAMDSAIQQGTDKNVSLRAPFLNGNKETILKKGEYLGVPYGLTRTCYADQPVACGRCGSCQERRAAFAAIGHADPIPYESYDVFEANKE